MKTIEDIEEAKNTTPEEAAECSNAIRNAEDAGDATYTEIHDANSDSLVA